MSSIPSHRWVPGLQVPSPPPVRVRLTWRFVSPLSLPHHHPSPPFLPLSLEIIKDFFFKKRKRKIEEKKVRFRLRAPEDRACEVERGGVGGLAEQKALPRVLFIPGRKVCAAGLRPLAPVGPGLVSRASDLFTSVPSSPTETPGRGVVPAALAAPQAPPLLWAPVHTARRPGRPEAPEPVRSAGLALGVSFLYFSVAAALL